MDPWQVITVLVVPTASAVWIWYTTKHLPAREAREVAKAQAREAEQVDTREHRQKQEDLQIAYHLSEGAAAHQVMAELIAMSQEREGATNEYIRKDIKSDLESIIKSLADMTSAINKLTETEASRAKLFTLQNGILSEMSHELRAQQVKISVLVEMLKSDKRE